MPQAMPSSTPRVTPTMPAAEGKTNPQQPSLIRDTIEKWIHSLLWLPRTPGLHIHVDRQLHQDFIKACQAEDKPAAQGTLSPPVKEHSPERRRYDGHVEHQPSATTSCNR